MKRRLFSGNNLDVADILQNLGGLYKAQSRYSEAEPLLREALEMRKRLFPGNHPHVADSLNNLG